MMKPQGLAVREVGEGVPVLFVHGWELSGSAEAHDFEPIFTKKPGYRRIYVDLPGMGGSPAGGIKDLDSMLDSLSGFVEKHVLPSTFLLVGTSCGAYLAQALAYRHADAIDGLLLRVPVIEPDTPKRDVDPFVPAISNDALVSSLSTADRVQLGDISVQTSEYVETYSRKLKDAILPAVAASDSAALDPIRNDPDRYRLTAALHTPENPFLKPALIMTGRQDTVVGYRDAWPLVARYPRATFLTLDRADHGLPIDETDLFEALVSNWLWRVEETRRVSRSLGSDSSVPAGAK